MQVLHRTEEAVCKPGSTSHATLWQCREGGKGAGGGGGGWGGAWQTLRPALRCALTQVAMICTSESLVRCIWEMSMIQDGLANVFGAYSDIVGEAAPLDSSTAVPIYSGISSGVFSVLLASAALMLSPRGKPTAPES